MKNSSLIVTISIIVILIGITLFFVNNKEKTSVKNLAIDECIALCKKAKENEVDLSNGPCLSDNNKDWKIKDWVCDVAHWPRKPIDNKPENQCQEFRLGNARHFVEVDENCSFIRAY